MKELIKGVCNFVFIHVPDKEKYLKPDNKFELDTSYEYWNHIKGIGRIVGIPQKTIGWENEGIQINFEAGDECLFHYLVISSEHNTNFVGNFDGMDVYKCPLHHLLATRQHGLSGISTWNMVGGWILCDLEYEDKPVVVEVDGKEVPVIMSKKVPGLIANANPRKSTRIARLVAIGPPLKGVQKIDVEVGDLVVFREGMNSELQLEGKTYLYMRQEELFAKYKTSDDDKEIEKN